jgi:DNA polymerase III subunit epsilon
MRQIVLDTETTGLDPAQGHRVIEIGAVEMLNRRLTGRHYHQYLWPDREIDAGALEVHGISLEFLKNSPRFGEVATEFLDFIRDAELIIHNAPFDVGFLNHELRLLGSEWGALSDCCQIVDTLVMARERNPGQKNSLDALCKRYNVDNSQRTLHGALLDAEILADVYLSMTGGQVVLQFDVMDNLPATQSTQPTSRPASALLSVLQPSAAEQRAHEQRLAAIDTASGGRCVWRLLYGDRAKAVDS